MVTHPASSLAQDRESSPAETGVLTTMLRRQLRTRTDLSKTTKAKDLTATPNDHLLVATWVLQQTLGRTSTTAESDNKRNVRLPVMWSETVGLRTRPVSDQKIGLAGLALCCETRSCHAPRHNDVDGHTNCSSTIYSKCFSILCLEHHYCGDQPLRSLT